LHRRAEQSPLAGGPSVPDFVHTVPLLTTIALRGSRACKGRLRLRYRPFNIS
jgi:hypothetical protein